MEQVKKKADKKLILGITGLTLFILIFLVMVFIAVLFGLGYSPFSTVKDNYDKTEVVGSHYVGINTNNIYCLKDTDDNEYYSIGDEVTKIAEEDQIVWSETNVERVDIFQKFLWLYNGYSQKDKPYTEYWIWNEDQSVSYGSLISLKTFNEYHYFYLRDSYSVAVMSQSSFTDDSFYVPMKSYASINVYQQNISLSDEEGTITLDNNCEFSSSKNYIDSSQSLYFFHEKCYFAAK